MAFALALVVVAVPVEGQAPGEVPWVDLLTEDAAAASEFYGKLVGWRFDRSPSGSLVALHKDTPIAGISEIESALPEDEAIWLVAIEVADLPPAVAAARRLGATIHHQGHVEGYGHYTVFEDPEGAPVMLIVSERRLGGEQGPGAWVWAELWTHDLDAASRFYTEVIGYERSEVDRRGRPYPVFLSGGEPRAGLVEVDDERIEPAWAPYLGVADIRATVARARELGGRVLLEPDEELSQGRVALLADPTGGAFFIYQLEEEAP